MISKKEQDDLHLLQEGNVEVFRRYFYQYNKRLYSYAIQYLKSRELAEEVVQEAFIKLWESRNEVNENVKGFLFVTTRNLTFNMIRNNKQRMLNRVRLAHHDKQFLSFEDTTELDSSAAMLLEKAVERLPEGKREIFKMKTKQGLSNEEIAFALSLTINTVKSQYYHASKMIREFVADHQNTKTG